MRNPLFRLFSSGPTPDPPDHSAQHPGHSTQPPDNSIFRDVPVVSLSDTVQDEDLLGEITDSIFQLCQSVTGQNPSLGHLDYYDCLGRPVHLRFNAMVPSSERTQQGIRLAAYWYVDTKQVVRDIIQCDSTPPIRLAELVDLLIESDDYFGQQVRSSIHPLPFTEELFTSREAYLASLRGELIHELSIISDEDSPGNLCYKFKQMLLHGGYPTDPEMVLQFIQYCYYLDDIVQITICCDLSEEESALWGD